MSMPAKVDYPNASPPAPNPPIDPPLKEEPEKNSTDLPTPKKDESTQAICPSDVILATAGYDDSIKLWEAHTGKLLQSLNYPSNYVTALEISPDGSLLVAGGHQCVKFYYTHNTKDEVLECPKLRKNVMDLGFHEDGKWMYVAGEDGTIQIWDIRSLDNVRYQLRHSIKASANTVELHPNQQELIIGDSLGNITIWNLRADKAETWTPAKESVINDVAVNPNGTQLAFVNNTGSFYVMPLKTALPESKEGLKTGLNIEDTNCVKAHKKYALRCKYSPDGKILATTSADQTSKLWNTSDYSLNQELKVENQRWVWDLAFSLDSEYLFTASSDNLARLWSLEKGKVVREYTGHQNALTCLAFRDVKADS